MALEHASDELKKDRKVVLAAVQKTGNFLRYASDELKDDCELLKIARQNGYGQRRRSNISIRYEYH